MLPKNTKIIAIDFDGTIVHDAYPKIGKPMIFAIDTMKQLQNQGHRLILWTYRSGRKLQEAVNFCSENGIEFYAVNKSYPEEVLDNSISRKIHADIFVDDRNFGDLPDWGKIYNTIIEDAPKLIVKKKNWFGF
jgi:hydroxymethylpyrimidine pyrophosphatase-like HAD family hydrolase